MPATDWNEAPWYPPHPMCERDDPIRKDPEDDDPWDPGSKRCQNRPVVAWDPRRHIWVCEDHATRKMRRA